MIVSGLREQRAVLYLVYGRWWPLVLILAGLGLLGEWAMDLRRETPVRRSGSFVGIIILLAFLGFGAAGWTQHAGPWFNQWNHDNNNDIFNMFGMPEHDNEHQQSTVCAGPSHLCDRHRESARRRERVTAG